MPDLKKALFVLTAPYSGSTALIRILETAPNAVLLHPVGEAARKMSLIQIKRYLAKNNGHFVCDKSMTNLNRAESIIDVFGKNAALLGLIRNPYAQCSSKLYRKMYKPAPNRMNRYKKMTHNKALELIANQWCESATMLKDRITKHDLPWIQYEWFADHTKDCIKFIQSVCPELEGMKPDTRIKVKDHESQPVRNFNKEQIARLSTDDISIIDKALDKNREVVEFFKYA
jgi:hypothetical protein